MAFASDKGRQGAAGVSTGGYSIDNSLRFNDDDSAYLSRTPSSAGNRKTWTWSGWLKFGNIKTADYPKVIAWGTGGTELSFYFNGNNLQVYEWSSGAYQFNLVTDAIYRDPSAWYHLVVAFDTTQSTASNRIKIYINGSQVTSFSTETYPSEDFNTLLNSSTVMQLGVQSGAGDYYDGYLAEVHFIDGQALDHTSFGETGTYGEWKPIEVTGMTYGTNGFYLDFGNTGDKHTITVQGDVQHTTSPKKIGDSSIHFLHNGGTADILKLSSYPSDLVFSGDFTYEFWAYKDDTSSSGAVFGNNESGYGVPCQWRMMSTGNMSIHMNGSSTWSMASGFGTSTSYTASVWQHWALVRSGSTITLYRDGVSQATTTSSQAQTLQGSSTFVIGGSQGSDYYNGHLDEIRISNTARYTSGFTPSTTAFTDDANTMLLIHSDTTVFESTTFTDDSGVVGGLGTDASSNTNNWTVNNLQPTDQMLDSPTNNFCTWNPGLSYYPGYNSIFSEGNLKGGRSDNGCVFGSILMTTGKWYAEMYFQDDAVAADASNMAALFSVDTATNISNSTFNSGISYRDTGDKVVDGTNTSYGASYSIGDIIGIAVDVDTGNVTFYKNNTSQGSISLGAGDDHVFACGGFGSSWSWVANFGQDSSFAGNDTTTAGPYTDGGGIGDFFYEPPSGYLALCTQNLPDPAVIPSEHFNTVTYAGNSSSQSITGVGFQPDFLWIKARNDIRSNTIWDAVRGINHQLYSDTISGGDSSDLASFDSDGFSFSSTTNHNYNNSANTYVAWNWNCPTTFSGNTDGSITSSGRTNTDAGMSIFTYTGTQANATVGHGLGSIPEMVIFKTLDADNWAVYHKKTTATGRMRLNLDAAVNTDSEFWQNTEPTSSLITLGFNHSTNATSGIIAYAFRSIEGYSKVGAYIGNGITDGAFVYTGFRPAYVMIKRASAGDWYIWNNKTDGYNVDNNHLRANYSSAENTDDDVDLLSNGFKWRTTNTGKNASGVTILYLAFAEQPFKHSNAR